MSKFFIYLLFVVVGISEASGQTTADPIREYNHALYSLKYKGDWTIDTTGDMGPAVLLFSPFSANGNRCYVSISTQPQSGENVSRDSMLRANMEFLPYSIEGFQLIATDTFELNGHPAFEMIYEGKQSGNQYRWRQTGLVVQGQLYMVTFAATPEGYKEFDTDAVLVKNSFIIHTSNP